MSNRYCTEAKGFDPYGEKYGLTCGYWTNNPKALDNHVIKHHFDDDECCDLFDSQYAEDKALRKASDNVIHFPGGGIRVEADERRAR